MSKLVKVVHRYGNGGYVVIGIRVENDIVNEKPKKNVECLRK